VGRFGNSHTPPRLPDGRVLGGRLLHIARDTEWEAALRSHFFVGSDLPELGHSPGEIAGTPADSTVQAERPSARVN
jgi:hypothetical protein